MKVSFDPQKEEWTRRERGFSLTVGAEVIRSAVWTTLDNRRDYGENRFVSYGYVHKQLFVCVYTIRGEVYHMISVREANSREVYLRR